MPTGGTAAGRSNAGQLIYLPTRTSGGNKRPLRQFSNYTLNIGTTGQATTNTFPDGATETVPPEPGADSVSIVMRWDPLGNPDHRWLANGGSKDLEFYQTELEIADSGAATASIAASGLVTISGTAPGGGTVGHSLLIGGMYYPIVAVLPKSPRTTVSSSLFENDVYVYTNADNLLGNTALSAVSAGSFKVVRPEGTTGTVSGTIQAPKGVGVGANPDEDGEETITFTPTAGLVFMSVPSAKNPYS